MCPNQRHDPHWEIQNFGIICIFSGRTKCKHVFKNEDYSRLDDMKYFDDWWRSRTFISLCLWCSDTISRAFRLVETKTGVLGLNSHTIESRVASRKNMARSWKRLFHETPEDASWKKGCWMQLIWGEQRSLVGPCLYSGLRHKGWSLIRGRAWSNNSVPIGSNTESLCMV